MATQRVVQELKAELGAAEKTIELVDRAVVAVKRAKAANASLVRAGKRRTPETTTAGYQRVGRTLRSAVQGLARARRILQQRVAARRNQIAFLGRSRE
jgi:hypothetical protein